MKKKLFMAAFACALMVFGNAALAQSQQAATFKDGVFSSNVSKNLTLLVATKSDVNLSANLAAVSADGAEKTLGYKRKDGNFVSLAQAVQAAAAKVESVSTDDGTKNANVASISLGKFDKNDTIQFGYQDAEGFHSFTTTKKVETDPGYYGGYEPNSFYQLDFSEDPFNGMFEIVIGEPLPAPAVTLIVALAAGALFLLYKNRKERSIQIEQA